MEKHSSIYTESTLVSKNVTIDGRRTSARLEPEMWQALNEIAAREQCTIHDICTLVARKKKKHTSLTAGIRVFLMLYYRAATTEEGHIRAGHGNYSAMQRRAIKANDDAQQAPQDDQSARLSNAAMAQTARYNGFKSNGSYQG